MTETHLAGPSARWVANRGYFAPRRFSDFVHIYQGFALSLSLPSDEGGALVNKRELARLLRTSVVTIGNWIERYGDEFPIRERGTNGREYAFDTAAVVAFLRRRQEEERRRQENRDEQLAQIVLPLNLPQEPQQQKSGVSVKEQLEALRLSAERRKEAVALGQLVKADEVTDALSRAFAALNRQLHAAVRSVGREFNLPEHVIRALDARFAETQRNFVREASAYLAPDEEPDLLTETEARAYG